MDERSEQEVDLRVLWRGVQRRLGWIIGIAVALSLAAFLWSRSQAPVYTASASLISAGNQANNDPTLGSSVVKAPPLPEGAVQQAMQSTLVIRPLLKSITIQNAIPSIERERLINDLSKELSAQRLKTVSLSSKVEQYSGGSGIYTVTAKARNPESAAILANLASQSLLDWDHNRATESVRRAEVGYRAQLEQIDQQLRAMKQQSGIEYQTLISRRATIQASLTNAAILADSATGVLSKLSDAVVPTQPESPKPVRNAVLAGLLSILLTTGVVGLMTVFDRTVRSEDDFLDMNLATLAMIPRLRQRDIVFSGIVRAARQAGLYEAIGFLRVNLLTALQGKEHPVLMITSTAPGEGKSSVTATLADGFAASGQRVLIIDADLRRGTQETVWKKFNEAGQWRQLTGIEGARTTREALIDPTNVKVLEVEPNVDMLPAGPSIHDSLAVFNNADLQTAIHLWRAKYDVVLIDSAPLLALADGLVLGKHADAVLMVSEYGRTNLQAIRSALRRAERAGLNIVGAVINKSDGREERSYGYSYSYSSKSVEKI